MHHEQSAWNLKPILYQGPSLERFSFASLVYYQDYLRSLTSPRFLNTPLVTQAILRGQLFPWVECQLPKPSYGICATGTSFDDYNDWTAGSLRKGCEVFHRNCSKNKLPRADVVKRDGLKMIRGCMHEASSVKCWSFCTHHFRVPILSGTSISLRTQEI